MTHAGSGGPRADTGTAGFLQSDLVIVPADVTDPRVIALVATHVAIARSNTGGGSAHALDMAGLAQPDMTLWGAYDGEALVGLGALLRLDGEHGEIKSMHTAAHARGRGVGAAMLGHIVAAARAAGLRRLSLETGSRDFFQPAHRLYRRHGFAECAPFDAYVPDPNSLFLTRLL